MQYDTGLDCLFNSGLIVSDHEAGVRGTLVATQNAA